MRESLQHKLDFVRRPRVQITYDVEIGNAVQMRELPFVMGVMADLSGMPETPLPKMKDRKFVEISQDNFTHVMESISPRLVLRVENHLTNDGSTMGAELVFKQMEDFEPLNVVQQIPGLSKLYEARTKLKDLLAKLDGNDELDDLLKEVINSTEQRDALKNELGMTDSGEKSSPKKGKSGKNTPVEEDDV